MYQDSSPERPAPVPPYVEAIESGRYRIHCRSLDGEPEAEIFAGPKPDQIDFSRPLAKLASSTVEVWPAPALRHYFAIRSTGEELRLATRNVPLSGVSNFRDLGGYPVGARRRTRWGCLYRSSDFHDLSDGDRLVLQDLGLKQVIDFRSGDESGRRPNQFGSQLEIKAIAIPIDPGSGAGFRSMWAEGTTSPGFMIEAMSTMNRILVRDHCADYRQMFDLLLECDGAPTAINCASGKDRTGVGSALILLSLGVDRDTVMRDYLLTNVYLQIEDRVKEGLANMARYTSRKIDPAVITPMYDARRPFLTAALDEIDLLHGGSEGYLRDALGFDDARFERMRELYLE